MELGEQELTILPAACITAAPSELAFIPEDALVGDLPRLEAANQAGSLPQGRRVDRDSNAESKFNAQSGNLRPASTVRALTSELSAPPGSFQR